MDETEALSHAWFGPTADDMGRQGETELSATERVAIDLARVPLAFGPAIADWLGTPDGADAAGMRRFLCDLAVRVDADGDVLLRKAAVVSVGDVRPHPLGWHVPIEWRSATFAPLFPVLAGRLVFSPDEVILEGYYAPPLGIVGHALDRALMSIAARRTAAWFLATVAAVVAAPI